MILTCPACGTRYAVKDGAIPPEGRQVRCASCKTSWHQNPEPTSEPEQAAEPPAEGRAHPEEFPAPAPMTHPAGEPGGKPPQAALSNHAHPDTPAGDSESGDGPDASPLPMTDAAPPPIDPEPTPATVYPAPEPAPPAEEPHAWAPRPPHREEEEEFAAYDPGAGVAHDETRGKGWVGLLLALLLIAALVAAFWFLAPQAFKERLGLAQVSGTPLLVQVDERSRRLLASGNQLLEVSGRVINPTDQPQRVPPLQAQLRSLDQKVVYRWTIPPPAAVVQPGGAAAFNSAELDIPASAACVDISFDRARPPTEPCRAEGEAPAAQAG